MLFDLKYFSNRFGATFIHFEFVLSRSDVDGIVLKVEDNKLEHVCTFPALGYVQVIDQILIDLL